MDSAKTFEDTLSATLEVLSEQALDDQGALQCMVVFELLPEQAKRALKTSRWWKDVLEAKSSSE